MKKKKSKLDQYLENQRQNNAQYAPRSILKKPGKIRTHRTENEVKWGRDESYGGGTPMIIGDGVVKKEKNLKSKKKKRGM